MTPAENTKRQLGGEWLPYAGHQCPVSNGTLVDVVLRNGNFGTRCHASRKTYEEDSIGDAMAHDWKTEDKPGDIVFYRLSPQTNL